MKRHPMHSICPYFAMFPEDFVRKYLEKFTAPGDYIFDPFSGRGTTLFQSLLMNRNAAAVDINPVAYCISSAKATMPSSGKLLKEIDSLKSLFQQCDQTALEDERQNLPPFFRRAFYHTTLRQVLFLRRSLRWKEKPLHRFIAALSLGSLHGEMDKSSSYFSNQMPRTISTKPVYSLKYWRENDLWPQKRDVFSILRSRAELRLSQGLPPKRGKVALSDVRRAGNRLPQLQGMVRAVVTSPPYLNVTNYEEDQWLRLWFLGSDPQPTYNKVSQDDRHESEDNYWAFLQEAWDGIASLLRKDAVLVCRLGAKGISKRNLTIGLTESLRATFPQVAAIRRPLISNIRNRQTEYFRPGSKGCLYEVDYVFRLN